MERVQVTDIPDSKIYEGILNNKGNIIHTADFEKNPMIYTEEYRWDDLRSKQGHQIQKIGKTTIGWCFPATNTNPHELIASCLTYSIKTRSK